MLANTTTNNQWTRHVLKTHYDATPEPSHAMCNAFLSLKQKKSLEDLFEHLDDSIAGKDTRLSAIRTKAIGKSRKNLLEKEEPQTPTIQEEDTQSPNTRIPRLHMRLQRKRPSLEAGMATSPTALKRRRSVGKAAASPHGPLALAPTETTGEVIAQTVQKGDKVKIVQQAKNKFLGLEGRVERFLPQKKKWGIVLENGSRIALGPESLKVLESSAHTQATPAKPKATPQRLAKMPRIQPRSSLGSTALALPSIPDLHRISPATEAEIAEFVAEFPEECRPKNDKMIMIAACVTGRKNIVVSLIMHSKIDVNIDFASASLLHVCIANDQPEVSLLLMEMGIEVDHQDSKGCTPLILAAKRGMTSVVAALCLAGANVNQTNKRKQTALMAAAMRGNLDIVDILLENEADVQLLDDMSQNALTKAMTAQDKQTGVLPAHVPYHVVDRLIQRMYEVHSKQHMTGSIKKL